MHTKDYLDVLAYLCAIAVAITVGRNNLKKQTIADQAALIVAMEKKIKLLEKQNAGQERRINCLEGKLNGDTQVVGTGSLAPRHRQGSGNSAASSQTTPDGGP